MLSAIKMKKYHIACPRACSTLDVSSMEVKKKQLQYSTLIAMDFVVVATAGGKGKLIMKFDTGNN